MGGVVRGHRGSNRSVIWALPGPARLADGAGSVPVGSGRMSCAVPESTVGASWCAERAAWGCALRSDWRGRALRVASRVAVHDDASRDRDERVPRMEPDHERPAMPNLLDGARGKCPVGAVAGMEGALVARVCRQPCRTSPPLAHHEPHHAVGPEDALDDDVSGRPRDDSGSCRGRR